MEQEKTIEDILDSLSPEDRAQLQQGLNFQRKTYAVLHFLLTFATVIVIWFIFKNWLLTLGIYLLGHIMLPVFGNLITQRGEYEVNHIIVGVGEDMRVIYGNFTKHYGILAVLRDTLFYGVVILAAFVFVAGALPKLVMLPFIIAVLFFALFRLMLYPIAEDVVQFFSKTDKQKMLDSLKKKLSWAVVILGCLSMVAFPAYVSSAGKAKINLNSIMANYYQSQNMENPYRDADLNKLSVEYTDMGLYGIFTYPEALELDCGLRYESASVKLYYNIFKNDWEVDVCTYVGEPQIVNPVTYKTDVDFSVDGGPQMPMTVSLTLESGPLSACRGRITFADQSTGEVQYTSWFTTAPYKNYPEGYPMKLDDPFPLAYFNVGTFCLNFEHIHESISIDTTNGVLNLSLAQE